MVGKFVSNVQFTRFVDTSTLRLTALSLALKECPSHRYALGVVYIAAIFAQSAWRGTVGRRQAGSRLEPGTEKGRVGNTVMGSHRIAELWSTASGRSTSPRFSATR